jgi:hypothetical protein
LALFQAGIELAQLFAQPADVCGDATIKLCGSAMPIALGREHFDKFAGGRSALSSPLCSVCWTRSLEKKNHNED